MKRKRFKEYEESDTNYKLDEKRNIHIRDTLKKIWILGFPSVLSYKKALLKNYEEPAADSYRIITNHDDAKILNFLKRGTTWDF